MYRYIMLILITRWIQNRICNMTKALNGQNFSKQFGKLWFCYCLFSFLLLPFFISNFINFFRPHSSCDSVAYDLIKYKHSKLVRINQMKLIIMLWTIILKSKLFSQILFQGQLWILVFVKSENIDWEFLKKCKIRMEPNLSKMICCTGEVGSRGKSISYLDKFYQPFF